MGYASSLLGGNVVSSYLHVDNLRGDLTAGKFWNAADGTETKYVQVSHDGSHGAIATNQGGLKITTANGEMYVFDTTLSKYLTVSHDGTDARLNVSSGRLKVSAGAYGLEIYNSGGSYCIRTSHNGQHGEVATSVGGIRIVPANNDTYFMDSSGGKWFSLRHDGSDAWLVSHDGDIRLQPASGHTLILYDGSGTRYFEIGYNASTSRQALNSASTEFEFQAVNNKFHFGSGSAQSRLYLYDTGAGAWKYLAINNGAIVVG